MVTVLQARSELQATARNTQVPDLDVLGLDDRHMAGQVVSDSNCASDFFADVRNHYQLSIVDISPLAIPTFPRILCS